MFLLAFTAHILHLLLLAMAIHLFLDLQLISVFFASRLLLIGLLNRVKMYDIQLSTMSEKDVDSHHST
jgi:hypothetical protein